MLPWYAPEAASAADALASEARDTARKLAPITSFDDERLGHLFDPAQLLVRKSYISARTKRLRLAGGRLAKPQSMAVCAVNGEAAPAVGEPVAGGELLGEKTGHGPVPQRLRRLAVVASGIANASEGPTPAFAHKGAGATIPAAAPPRRRRAPTSSAIAGPPAAALSVALQRPASSDLPGKGEFMYLSDIDADSAPPNTLLAAVVVSAPTPLVSAAVSVARKPLAPAKPVAAAQGSLDEPPVVERQKVAGTKRGRAVGDSSTLLADLASATSEMTNEKLAPAALAVIPYPPVPPCR